jgi:hypothetical protein
VNQKVKTIFKLRGNRDREELPHCAVLTVPVEEFSHLQYSNLPSVEWQQRGQKHGRCFARLQHRRTNDDLKMAITEYIPNADRAILKTVFENTVRRVNICLGTGGRHFEHYL